MSRHAGAGFLDRVGGVLIHPRTTLGALARSTDGGLTDVAVLLGLRLVAGETRVGGRGPDSALILARGVLWLGRGEPTMALQGVLQAVSRLLPDLLAILVGSVALGLLARRKTRGRELDLAALAWVPALLVKTAGALGFTILGRDPSAGEQLALDVAALGWAMACWGVALWTLRTAGDSGGRP